jgi:hypothetical protein
VNEQWDLHDFVAVSAELSLTSYEVHPCGPWAVDDIAGNDATGLTRATTFGQAVVTTICRMLLCDGRMLAVGKVVAEPLRRGGLKCESVGADPSTQSWTTIRRTRVR